MTLQIAKAVAGVSLATSLAASNGDSLLSKEPTHVQLSPLERAFIEGDSATAHRVIVSSAQDLRPAVIAPHVAHVVERVIQDLMNQGEIEEARVVARCMQRFSLEQTAQGTALAFATMPREKLAAFCDTSLSDGPRCYRQVQESLVTPQPSKSIDSAKVVEMNEVLTSAARRDLLSTVAAGAVSVVSLVASIANAAANNRLACFASSAVTLFCSTLLATRFFNQSMSLFDTPKIGTAVCFLVSLFALQQGYKAIKDDL
jgi:hypothetical protein